MTMKRAPRPASPRRQRGAALLTAMVIVTLIVTLAASMVWQQWRAVQVESAERARRQASWILSGALDWSRLILREDARSTANIDHLGEPWAVPLAEARLSTFLAADKDNTDDAPEAFLSGSITDAQGLFNLRNLIDGNGKIIPEQLQGLERLCEFAGIPVPTASAIALGLRDALAANTGGDADAPLPPKSVNQLGWFGIPQDVLRKLRTYAILLPRSTPLNLNTASREVLAASIPGLDLGSAERLVQGRQRNPFNSVSEAQALLPQGVVFTAVPVDVKSNFFEVHGRLRLGERVLEERSLVERQQLTVVVLEREQLGLIDSEQQR